LAIEILFFLLYYY